MMLFNARNARVRGEQEGEMILLSDDDVRSRGFWERRCSATATLRLASAGIGETNSRICKVQLVLPKRIFQPYCTIIV